MNHLFRQFLVLPLFTLFLLSSFTALAAQKSGKELLKSLQQLKPEEVPAAVEKLSNDDSKSLIGELDEVLQKATEKGASSAKVFSLVKPYAMLASKIEVGLESPVTNPVAKKLLFLEDRYYANMPKKMLQSVKGHRLASLAGEIPEGTKPKTVETTVSSRGDKGGKEIVSTGVYALPGVEGDMKIPNKYSGQGLQIQIGHSGPAGEKNALISAPETKIYIPVDSSKQSFISPNGGMIFLIVPRHIDMKEVPLTFTNVIETPRFILGKTTDEQWKTIRNNPAPWGELVSEHLILVAHRYKLEEIDNPTELMEFWNAHNRDLEDFYAHYPKMPFRIHGMLYGREGISFWPLECNYTGMERTLSADLMKLRSDGLFLHEHGHHCDFGDMEISHFSEATCNWGGYYLRETKTPFGWKEPHSSHLSKLLGDDPEHMVLRRPKWYEEKGGAHGDSFRITSMMVGYAEDFGWDAIKTVVHRLRDRNDPMYKWPFTGDDRSNQAKIDRYLIGLSEAAKHDVRPYFAHFQFIPSRGAAAYLDKLNLPKWDLLFMKDFEDAFTEVNQTLIIPNPAEGILTLAEGKTTVEWLGQAENGIVGKDAKGNISYTPNEGFKGFDRIPYRLHNKEKGYTSGKRFMKIKVGSDNISELLKQDTVANE